MDLPEPDNPPAEPRPLPDTEPPTDATGPDAHREAPEAAADRPPPPPLRIHHVMLLTVVVAVMATIMGAFPAWTEGTTVQIAVWRSYQVVYAIMTAIGVTLTLLGIEWHRRGLAYWNEPGQFLAMFYVFSAMFYPLALLDYWHTGDPYGDQYSTLLRYLLVPVYLLFDVFLAIKFARRTAWRTYFWVCVAVIVITVPIRYEPWYASAAMLALTGWVSLSDFAKQPTRHWSHWLGCLLVLVEGALSVFIGLLSENGFFDPPA